jgi:hypothetical protein
MRSPTALAIPRHNLYADHGPRCHPCSGLGSVLTLGSFGGATNHASRCSCKGTGIDQEALLQKQIAGFVDRMEQGERERDSLTARIAKLERTALARARRLNDRQTFHKGSKLRGSSQSWQELIHYIIADATSVANTTTEAVVVPNVTIPGNYMARDRALRFQIWGKLSTTGTPTMVWAVRFNGVAGTLLATTELITMGSGVTNVNWSMSGDIQTRSSGSAGSIIVTGELKVHTSSTAVSLNVFGVSGFDAPASVGSLDLTADWPLSITADWSAASASNTITAHQYYLESLN